jgi:hypothetical protein
MIEKRGCVRRIKMNIDMNRDVSDVQGFANSIYGTESNVSWTLLSIFDK